MVNASPKVMRWARETAGLSLEEASQRLGISHAGGARSSIRLQEIEEGIRHPSRSILAKMATQYRRPLLVFYLSTPPLAAPRGEDYRSLVEEISAHDEALLSALIRDVRARQSMVRAVLEDEDEAKPLGFVGKATLADQIADMVKKIHKQLGLELAAFRSARDSDAAFSRLRTSVESAGVFVLLAGDLGSHHTSLGTEVFRGVALSDSVAPFIVINDNDSRSAWSFSLLHELTHLWLGQSGISGEWGESKVERYCNEVASEFLLPATDLADFNLANASDTNGSIKQIGGFARPRHVSGSLVAYRLFRQRKLTTSQWEDMRSTFDNQWREYVAAKRERQRVSETGPDYYVVRRHRIGEGLVALVARMLQSGALTTTKAGRILGVKPGNVYELVGPR